MRIQAHTLSRVIIVAIALVLVLAPAIASAVSWIPVVPCGKSATDLCTPCHLLQTGKNVIDLILFGVTGPIAAFMVVFAGGEMLLGGGNPAMFSRGKLLLKNTLIGVAIILVAWAATNFLIKGLGGGASGTPWYEFTCPAGLAAISKIDTEFAQATTQGTSSLPKATPPAYVGTACPDDSLQSKLCGTAADLGVTCKPCTNIGGLPVEDIFTKYAEGVATPQLLQAIMIHESSCGANLESPKGAYGPMQLQPATANRYRDACQIVTKDADGNDVVPVIDASWLLSQENWDKSVCLAAKYLNSLTGTCGRDPRNLAANYNGAEACLPSISCAGETSCGGGQKKRWECVWENREHSLCNANRAGGGYRETRKYAPEVAACATLLGR